MAKKKLRLKKTACVVGEGLAEKAFINYLKSMYNKDNYRVTAKSAGGKGPSNVIKDTIGTYRAISYDRMSALLDTDIPWPKTVVEEAEGLGIELFASKPCLESTLADILGVKKPQQPTNKQLKALIHPLLNGSPTCKNSYGVISKAQLEAARKNNSDLDKLLSFLEDS